MDTSAPSAETPGPSGFLRPPEVQDQGGPAPRPRAHAWITDELIQEHRQVWSGLYRRVVGEEEAIEIIMSIRRFGEAILRAVGEAEP